MRGHLLSRFVLGIVEHKRFRSVSAFFLSVVVLLTSGLTPVSAFTAEDFESNTLATEEVILTTKKTSRLPVVGRLSQGFNFYHPGIDIEKPFSEPVNPFLAGAVFETGFQSGGYGNYVLINHKNGYFSLYAHLNKVLVKRGDEVSYDTIIGTVGLTGQTTGSHLHFELYENGIAVHPLSILPELPVATASASFVGGPSALPQRTLILPISQQPPLLTQQQQTSKKQEKPALGIWLPDELISKARESDEAKADSKANHQLSKLDLF